MAARNFIATFALLALAIHTGSTYCAEVVDIPCNGCYNEIMCGENCSLMLTPGICVGNTSANCTSSQIECGRLHACPDIRSQCGCCCDCNVMTILSGALANSSCVNDSQALLSVCKQVDDIPDTLEKDCFLSCGPLMESEESSPSRLTKEECNEIERTFCRRPGRGQNCTGRCIQSAGNACQKMIENILRGNFTRDDVAASAEALRFYPHFLSNSSIDLDEVVGSVDSFHRALKRQRQSALEYYNETETIDELVGVYDNLLGDGLMEIWINQTQMSGLGPMLLQSLENALELFAESAQMNSKGVNITRRSNIEMHVDCSIQEHYQRTLSLSTSGETVFTSFDLPLRKVQSTEGNGCVSASVTRHLADYVHFNSSEFNQLSPAPNTPLLSINALGRSIPNGQKAYLYFSRSQMANSTVENITCVFWNFSKREWTVLLVEWNDTHFKCSTSHITSFAILVTVTSTEVEIIDTSRALTIISYIGCGISITCLLVTILALLILRKKLNKGVLLYIHLNFAIALLASLVVFVAGIETANHIGWLCTLVAALLHYLFLCVFCWMLAEGIMLYLLVVRVFGTAAEKWYYLLILGWGLPIPVVVISVGVRHMDYGNKNYCWLSVEQGTIWAFVAPVLAIIVVNSVILVMTVFSIVKMKAKFSTEMEHRKRLLLKTAIKSTVVLLPLLGLTWAFGLLAVGKNTTVFAWLFTVFNSLQGLFVFILHVLKNDYFLSKAKIILRRLLCVDKRPAHSEVLLVNLLINNWNNMSLDSDAEVSQENISTSVCTSTAKCQDNTSLDTERTERLHIITEEEQFENVNR